MKVLEQGVLLRIFVGESDQERCRDRPLDVLPVMDELVTEGLVTLEAVRVLSDAAPGDLR